MVLKVLMSFIFQNLPNYISSRWDLMILGMFFGFTDILSLRDSSDYDSFNILFLRDSSDMVLLICLFLLESPARDDISVKGNMRVFKNPARDGIEGSYVFHLLISPKLYFIPMGFNDIWDAFWFYRYVVPTGQLR
ncbi:MAG: hypothetical protein HXX16_12640 [Bacteroidales bacterium]|nr:hypothetical protein [Bacteroidales bacterium]